MIKIAVRFRKSINLEQDNLKYHYAELALILSGKYVYYDMALGNISMYLYDYL